MEAPAFTQVRDLEASRARRARCHPEAGAHPTDGANNERRPSGAAPGAEPAAGTRAASGDRTPIDRASAGSPGQGSRRVSARASAVQPGRASPPLVPASADTPASPPQAFGRGPPSWAGCSLRKTALAFGQPRPGRDAGTFFFPLEHVCHPGAGAHPSQRPAHGKGL